MPRLLSELLDLPERVHRGDFVLSLSGGVQDPETTASSYVVTPQLERCFQEALGFIQSALESRSAKATYLHGSFGSGKSHFMAILYLLLENHPAVTRIPELAAVCAKTPWRTEKKCLLVPYHLIGARDLESAILGGYVDYAGKHHPDAPLPGVYRAEALFRDAQSHREQLGDEKFFALLSRSKGRPGWGAMATGWTVASFDAALAAPAGDKKNERGRLIADLVENIFPSYQTVVRGQAEAFVPLDDGLAILSQHAQALGYDALILFLDELILWLASHAQNLPFVHQEGQKLAKLVEAQSSERPVPIISFVARQRDLRELVGEAITGAEQLGFADALKHWEGRFHTITLEDRNLPVIAEKRVLRPKNAAARAEIDQAFRETEKVRAEVMEILLTRDADRTMFRQVYPFSPALVQCLVAVSSALQRERTALKIMMQLLVDKRGTLEVGEVVPVGDLWDQVARGEEAFVPGMHHQFEMARRLWHRKLLPMLEDEHGVRIEHDIEPAAGDVEVRARLERFAKDARLLKTLLLAALVPEVEALRSLSPTRLAALNHGSIRSPVPGREGQIALEKLRKWAGRVGELRISPDAANPTISIQLVDVDIDSIIEAAQSQDNAANRQRKLRTMLFDAMRVAAEDRLLFDHELTWRGTKRRCSLGFYNVREAPLSNFENDDREWKLVIDFPFDTPGHTPRDDLARLDEFRQADRRARTLVWVPEFFSREMQAELGKLVVIDYLLRGDNLTQHAKHLSLEDRTTAKQLLENQQHELRAKALRALEGAYGIRKVSEGLLDPSFDLERDKFQSLEPGFQPQPVVAPDFEHALEHFLAQALAWQFPGHPEFQRDIKRAELEKILEVCLTANRDANRRVHVEDKKLRPVLAQVCEPLGLGRMRENLFVLDVEWRDLFSKELAANQQTSIAVRDLRRWCEKPKPRGLPSDVEDLLMIVYAAQVQYSCYLFDGASSPRIGSLHDDVVLRPFHGPPEDTWQKAQAVGGHIFGVATRQLLDPENLARFAAGVTAKTAEHQNDARELPALVRDRLVGLGVDAAAITAEGADSARYRTARAVAGLIERLRDRETNDVVREIAAAAIDTSAPAMGKSLTSSREVVAALDGNDWQLFDALGEITDGRRTAAAEILAELRDTLRADEVAQPLVAKLGSCRTRALALLTRPAAMPAGAVPTAKPPPRTPNPAPGSQGEEAQRASDGAAKFGSGSAGGLDRERLAELAQTLGDELAADEHLRLDISWRVRRVEGER